MYASRYERSKPSPLSLTAAVGINAALVGALLFSAPVILVNPDRPLVTYPVPDEPPPPQPPEPARRTTAEPSPAEPTIAAPIPEVVLPRTSDSIVGTPDPIPLPPVDLGPPATGAAGSGLVVDPPKPAPVLVDASPDPRADFQPDYPAAERRDGAEGAVTVRVLVGADGRVKSVERVRAASDAFWEATRRTALNRWRFRPATRDGVPYESWRTMTVRFVLEE